MSDSTFGSGGYSYGPAFTALSVPSMGSSFCFRGPAIKAYQHGPIAPGFRTGTYRTALTTGPHRAVTAAASAAAPGLGARIDVYAGK